MSKHITTEIGYKLCGVIHTALNGGRASVDERDLDKLFLLSCKHRVSALVASTLDKDNNNYEQWENALTLSVMRKIHMDAQRQEILAFLQDNHIWYLLMKGLVLENLYPQPYLREMCDNDILYDEKGYKMLKKYMLEKGYEIEYSSDSMHVDEYKKGPYFFFEMHKRFFSTTKGDIAQYYADISRLLVPVSEYEYKLNNEDFYVYMIAHSYKHFIDGGTGLRSFLDCYLYNEKVNYDNDYVKNELKKLNLVEFEKQFRCLSYKLFSGERIVLSKEEEEVFLYVISSGAYGTKDNYINNKIKNNGKFRYIISRAFPDLVWLKDNVPFCYKHRWTIPFYYLYRIFDRTIRHTKRIIKEIKIIKKIK